MFKLLLAVCIVAGVVYGSEAEIRDPRLLLVQSVTTTTKWLTTTSTCTTATTCAVLVNATSQCRRRRGIQEKPVVLSLDEDVLEPSKPQPVEATQLPTEGRSGAHPELESSSGEPSLSRVLPIDQRGITLSLTTYAFTISPISSYFVTLLKTSTVTSGVSCLSVLTFTHQYTVSGCSPSAIVTCAASG